MAKMIFHFLNALRFKSSKIFIDDFKENREKKCWSGEEKCSNGCNALLFDIVRRLRSFSLPKAREWAAPEPLNSVSWAKLRVGYEEICPSTSLVSDGRIWVSLWRATRNLKAKGLKESKSYRTGVEGQTKVLETVYFPHSLLLWGRCLKERMK